MVTAATPLVVTENGRSTISAVVGLQMKYSRFSEMFLEVAALGEGDCKTKPGDDEKSSKSKKCKLTCNSEVNIWYYIIFINLHLYRSIQYFIIYF